MGYPGVRLRTRLGKQNSPLLYGASMHAIDPMLDRLLRHLALKLKYDISDGEVNLYRQELTGNPYWKIADVCIEAEREYRLLNMYPSLAWFKSRLKTDTITKTPLRA